MAYKQELYNNKRNSKTKEQLGTKVQAGGCNAYSIKLTFHKPSPLNKKKLFVLVQTRENTVPNYHSLFRYFMIQRTKTKLPNKQPHGSVCTRHHTPPSTDPDLVSGLPAALATVGPSLQLCAGGLCHEHAEGARGAHRVPEMNANTLLLPSVRG